MEAERKLRPWELALLLALCFTLLCGTWAQGRQQVLAGKLVRLHVIAASDADEAQAVKLQVRDAVLAYLEPKLADVTDVDAAQEIIAANLDGVAQAARTVTPDAVTVTLGPERYPTREYETFSLPAGVYTSLRVTLSAGEGHNWWCVIFPPLCMESSLSDRAVETLSDDDVKLITEDGDGYVLRFRLLELWGKLTERLEK